MKGLVRALYIIVVVILTAIIIYNLYISYVRYRYGEDRVLSTKVNATCITSGSMEPALHVGDLVITLRQEEYSVGDIITYTDSTGMLITHRITGMLEGGYATKGDANDSEDLLLVPESEISGRMILRLPYMGRVLDVIRGPIGRIIILALIGVCIVLAYRSVRDNKQ